jgi:hypothetical protein
VIAQLPQPSTLPLLSPTTSFALFLFFAFAPFFSFISSFIFLSTFSHDLVQTINSPNEGKLRFG